MKSPKIYKINQSHLSLLQQKDLIPNYQMTNFTQRLRVNGKISAYFNICTVLQDFIKRVKILCLVVTRIVVYQNTLRISLHIVFILFISRQVKKSKNMKIQQVHQKIHTKQFYYFV